RMTLNAPKHIGASGASTPPARAASALPSRISRQASPMPMVPDAQDIAFVAFGPVTSRSIAIEQLAAPAHVVSATRGSMLRAVARAIALLAFGPGPSRWIAFEQLAGPANVVRATRGSMLRAVAMPP